MADFTKLKGLMLEFPISGHTFELRYWPKENPTKGKFQEFNAAVEQAQTEIFPDKTIPPLWQQRPLRPGIQITGETSTAWEYLGLDKETDQDRILQHALRVAEIMELELEFDTE